MTPAERKHALIQALNAIEALTREVDLNPAGHTYTPNAKSLVHRAQITMDDLVHEATEDGWLTPEEAADAVFQARHGVPAEERQKASRKPR